MIDVNLEAVRKAVEKPLLDHPGVVGVSYHHSVPTIVIYVESEEDARAMPRTIAGLPVEVRVVGKVRIQAERVRPLIGGVSGFASGQNGAGTLGVVTLDGKILSNAHVIAINFETSKWLKIGHPVVQPAPLDGGTEGDIVGYLEDYVPIVTNSVEATNYVDGAIAECTVDYRPMWIKGVGEIKGWTDPTVGLPVKKVGRTTEYTESVITDIGATVKIHGYPWGWAVIKDCVICGVFSQAGDSGSLIVTRDNVAVALLCAGSEYITVGCNIRHVIEALDVDLGEKAEVRPEVAVMGAFPLMLVGGIILSNEVKELVGREVCRA